MAVQVYGVNHVAIEVDDAQKAAAFYADVFGLEMLRGGEGAAWCKLGEHQFLAIFEVERLQPDRTKHFGIMVRDEAQITEVRDKLERKYGLTLHPDFRCDFRDPWGNRIQVGDLHDESLVWLLPYREVQQLGISFIPQARKEGHRTPMNTIDLRQRLQGLLDHIRNGKIIEAMNEFYDKDTVMQDNANPPTKGLAANIEREKQFLSGVKEWKGFEVKATGVGDNVTFYECTMDFVATNGQPVHMEQVSAAKWRDGKIVHERFYYDTGIKR